MSNKKITIRMMEPQTEEYRNKYEYYKIKSILCPTQQFGHLGNR